MRHALVILSQPSPFLVKPCLTASRIPAACEQCRCTALTTLLAAVIASQQLAPKLEPSPVELALENVSPRIIFASVPRSGNSWMRQLIEASTGYLHRLLFFSFRECLFDKHRPTGLATETVFPQRYSVPVNESTGEKVLVEAAIAPYSRTFGHVCGRGHFCNTVKRSEPG